MTETLVIAGVIGILLVVLRIVKTPGDQIRELRKLVEASKSTPPSLGVIAGASVKTLQPKKPRKKRPKKPTHEKPFQPEML